MNKLYAIYKQTSDLNDLPDYVLCLCSDCAAFPSTRTAIELNDAPADACCTGCN